MPYWKLTLGYDGTGFHGWQVQPGLVTVQGTLADAVRRVTGEHVLPQASGRTDTGVHALAQVATLQLDTPLPADNLLRALNNLLPPSIRVLTVKPASPTFHARYSALRKTYEYRIFERRLSSDGTLRTPVRICSPFLAPYIWDCHWPLDLDALHAATLPLVGEHDFTSFAATDPDRAARGLGAITRAGVLIDPSVPRGNVRTLHAAGWTRTPQQLTFRVTGSGFLHNMVRNLVGTLVDVGRGFLSAASIQEILAARHRSAAGPTAPARGLFLLSVEYPESGAPEDGHPEAEPMQDGQSEDQQA